MSNSLITTNTNLPTTSSTSQKEEPINIFKSLKPKNKQTIKEVPHPTKLKLSTLTTKSQMIRYLNKEGYTKHQISQILSIRYQHVYNVLNQIIKS